MAAIEMIINKDLKRRLNDQQIILTKVAVEIIILHMYVVLYIYAAIHFYNWVKWG